MSLKNFVSAAAVVAAMSTLAMAQSPTISIKDAGVSGGQRSFDVIVSADDAFYNLDVFPEDGTMDAAGMAAELGISVHGANIVSFTETADWQDNNDGTLSNPGDNPFTGGVTEGIVIEANNTDVFASLGSTGDVSDLTLGAIQQDNVLGTLVVDAEIALVYLGADNSAGVASLLAQDNALVEVSGTFGINGDFDLDNDVDFADFGVFNGQYLGPPNAGSENADFDGDGTVTFADFGVFNANYLLAGPAPGVAGASTVPEPAGIACLLIGAMSMLGVRCRS